MHRYAGFTLSLAMLWGCSSTVLVPVPPRMDLKSYGTLGIVEFASNSDRTINAHATRQFQEQIQAAQPGTRFIELGNREALLAAVGGRQQLDPEALRKVREKYAVAAIFVGDIVYSEPKTDVKLTDLTRLEGGVRTEIRADMSSRLVETTTGASVWSSSSWVRRQIGHLNVSADGVSAGMGKSNPREEMMPALVYHLARDFRPSSVRQPAK
jgi:hypothetical protein